MRRCRVLYDKEGLSHHIEMVLSFVMFIGFVFFVLIFVKPYGNDFLTGSVVQGAQYNFMESAQTDLVTFFISLDTFDMDGATCFSADLPSEFISTSLNTSFVRFVNGSILDSEVDANTNVLESRGNHSESYYVFLSDEFEDESLSGCVDAKTNVSFGSFREEKIISEKKLKEIEVLYYSDYDLLRQNLAIPDVFDFAIVSEVVSMEKDIPTASEVFAEDYVRKVLLESGEIKIVRFTVKLWR